MSPAVRLRFASLGGGLLALAAPAVLAAPGGPQSAAVGIEANFVSQGIASQLGPIAQVNGQAAGKYDDVETVAKVAENVAITAQLPPVTIFANAHGLTSHASASGILIDSRSSEGDTAIAGADISLNLNPPPPAAVGPVPQPFLNIAASQVVAQADFSLVYGGGQSFTQGTVSFGNLKINGQLIGGAVLRYSGPAAPNTVIYDTPTVTITLNRQIRSGLISCDPGCALTPVRIDVAAVDIELTKAVIRGKRVTGDILIGEQNAQ